MNKKPRKPRKATKPAKGNAIKVRPIGTAVELLLRKDADGKAYTHRFSKPARVCVTLDNKHLVIMPVRVKGNVIQD